MPPTARVSNAATEISNSDVPPVSGSGLDAAEEALALAEALAEALALGDALAAGALAAETLPVPPPSVKPPDMPGPPPVPPGPGPVSPGPVPPGPVPPGPVLVLPPPVQCGFWLTALPLEVHPGTLPLLFRVPSPFSRPQGSERSALEPPLQPTPPPGLP